MTSPTRIPAREPASDILPEATSPVLERHLKTQPSGAGFVHTAIGDSLGSRKDGTIPRRFRIALNTAMTLCARHAGKRLVSITVQRAKRVIAHCFAMDGLPDLRDARVLEVLALTCQGGVPVPFFDVLDYQVRVDHVSRSGGEGAGYRCLARCLATAPVRVHQTIDTRLGHKTPTRGLMPRHRAGRPYRYRKPRAYQPASADVPARMRGSRPIRNRPSRSLFPRLASDRFYPAFQVIYTSRTREVV